MSDEFFAKIEVSAQAKFLEDVLQFVEDQVCKTQVSSQMVHHLRLLTEEIFLNCVQHGYPGGSPGTIQISCTQTPQQIFLEFIDDGQPFNPLKEPLTKPSLDIEERPLGHVGLHLIRQLATKNISYSYKEGKNHLSISIDLNKEIF